MQRLEASLGWACWALDLCVISTPQLHSAEDSKAPPPGVGTHAVAALCSFFEAVHSAAGQPGGACIVPGSERTLRRVTLTVLDFQRQVC